MKCPNDGATLLMAERRGVAIDYCPECRGVWLERGRLDQLLDADARDDHRADDHRGDDGHRSTDHGDDNHQSGRKRKGVGGLLGDLLGGD